VAATEIGVDQGTLARWERGEREPTGALLENVTRFLGGDTERLTRCGAPGSQKRDALILPVSPSGLD
jgi:transcriptional regulator with XRE-family HTH domain